MSHFVVGVILPKSSRPGGEEGSVQKLLGPYSEEHGSLGSKWDWWAIGGRWEGMMDPTYDAEKDPRNFEKCDLCDGTGNRTDAVGMTHFGGKSCNGCKNTGTARKFQNAPTDKNIGTVETALTLKPSWDPEAFPFFALVTPDGEWNEKGEMGWFATVSNENKDWPKAGRAILEAHKGHRIVVVDCHI